MPIPVRSMMLSAGITFCIAGCDSTTGVAHEQLHGRWTRTVNELPPVTLELRTEGSATVGQVWLSGTTYTLPAILSDTSVVLANPVSSALAPFSGVVTNGGEMHATLRGTASEFVVVLRKEQ